MRERRLHTVAMLRWGLNYCQRESPLTMDGLYYCTERNDHPLGVHRTTDAGGTELQRWPLAPRQHPVPPETE